MNLVIFLLGFISGALSVVAWALRVNEAKEAREQRKRGSDGSGETSGPPPPVHPMCKCCMEPILKGDDADGQDDSE